MSVLISFGFFIVKLFLHARNELTLISGEKGMFMNIFGGAILNREGATIDVLFYLMGNLFSVGGRCPHFPLSIYKPTHLWSIMFSKY